MSFGPIKRLNGISGYLHMQCLKLYAFLHILEHQKSFHVFCQYVIYVPNRINTVASLILTDTDFLPFQPIESIPLDNVNVVFVPDKMEKPNGFQITYPKDQSTRNIFVYCDNQQVRKRLGNKTLRKKANLQ